jgi:hypothetical protein
MMRMIIRKSAPRASLLATDKEITLSFSLQVMKFVGASQQGQNTVVLPPDSFCPGRQACFCTPELGRMQGDGVQSEMSAKLH